MSSFYKNKHKLFTIKMINPVHSFINNDLSYKGEENEQMTINTILFDFDGTLVDTNELIYHSFVHTFDTYGYSFSKEEILTFNGPPLRDTFQKINPNLVDEMVETY